MPIIPNYSAVNICNLALNQLSEQQIEGLTDSNKAARLCNTFFEQSRDELLRAYDWNFSSSRAVLAQLSTSPLFGWDFAYALPSDYLMLRNREDYGLYRIEDGKLYSNLDSTEFNIRYTRRIDDYNDCDPLFIECWYLYLAYKIAFPLTGDRTLRGEMLQYYKDALIRAKQIDDMEDHPDEEPTEWTDVGRSLRVYGNYKGV